VFCNNSYIPIANFRIFCSEFSINKTPPYKKISGKAGKIKPGIKTKGFFTIMSMMQKNGFNPADVEYWKEKNWTTGNRPWKK